MREISVIKVLTLLSSILVVAVPVIYGLNVYGWNIQALTTPVYSPPKIGFNIEFSGVRFEGGQLYGMFKITNQGEVRIVFEGFNGKAYGPDNEALALATLDRAVVLPTNSTETLILKANIDGTALNKLASYFIGGLDRVNIEVRGDALIRVLGSRVTVPVSTSFEISLTDILKR